MTFLVRKEIARIKNNNPNTNVSRDTVYAEMKITMKGLPKVNSTVILNKGEVLEQVHFIKDGIVYCNPIFNLWENLSTRQAMATTNFYKSKGWKITTLINE